MAILLRRNLKNRMGMVLAYVLLLTQSLLIIVMFCLFRAVSFTHVLNEGVRQNVIHDRVWQSFLRIPISSDSSCRIPVQSFATLSKQPLSWWQKNGCEHQENGVHYYHVIEALGIDHCALTDANSQSQKVADYYRLSLYAIADGMRYQPVQMQATYAIPVLITQPCSGVMHSVKQGLQSLREW